MKLLYVFLTVFILFQIFSASSIEETYPLSARFSRDFYKIYIDTLYYIDNDLPFRYGVNEKELANLLKDIKIEREIVERLNLDENSFATKYDRDRVDRFLTAKVYRFLLKKDVVLTTDILRKYFNEHPDFYPAGEHVVAWQIFVEADEKSDEKEIQSTLSKIGKRLKTEPFTIVARDYYKTVGLDFDGKLGRIFRGQIGDDNFEPFINADPEKSFFGPIKQKRGYLFGKVARKLTRNSDPIQYYRERLELDCRSEQTKKILNEFYDRISQNLKPQVYSFDKDKKEPLKYPAYRIKGKTITFEELGKRLPQLMGDYLNPDFHHSLRQKCLDNDLIYFSPEAKKIKNTPEYRYLSQAQKNAWLVSQYVNKEMEKFKQTPESLKKFYDENKNTLYAQSDTVRLVVVTLLRNLDLKDSPYQQHLKQKTDFETIHNIREAYLNNPTEENLKSLRSSITGLVFDIYDELRPSEQAGRIIESQLMDHEPGYISPVLIGGKTRYLFFHILAMEKRPPLSLEEVKDRIESDYSLHKKREILKRLYRTDRVLRYF